MSCQCYVTQPFLQACTSQNKGQDETARRMVRVTAGDLKTTTWPSGRCPCAWQGGWNWVIYEASSNPNHSVIP